MDATSLDILTTKAILERKRREPAEALKTGIAVFVSVLLFFVLLGVFAFQGAPFSPDFFLGLLLLFFGLLTGAVSLAIIFWPIMLGIVTTYMLVRQNILLSLVRTALETGTSIPQVLHCHALALNRRSWYRRQLDQLVALLQSGLSMEEALRHKRCRSLIRYDVLCALRLGSGEKKTFDALRETVEEQQFRTRVQTATLARLGYLFALVFAFLLITTFQLVLIMPKFAEIFKDFGIALPTITLFVMNTSHYAVMFFPLIALFFLVALPWLFFFGILYLFLQSGVMTVRPVGFRTLCRSFDAARFLRILSIGIARGKPLEQSVLTYIEACPSTYLKNRAQTFLNRIVAGYEIAPILRGLGYLNANEEAFVASANKTGNLAFALEQLAATKEERQIAATDSYSKLLFIPAILLFGAIVGTFMIAMFLPLTHLIKALC